MESAFKVKADGWLVKKNNCTGRKVGPRVPGWGGVEGERASERHQQRA